MKRVNITLLAWLLSSTLVLAVGVHFLHAYQMTRNASSILNQAESAQHTGNNVEAVKLFKEFLNYRPKDREVNEELANLMIELAEKPGHTFRQVSDAKNFLEKVLVMHPELTKLRRRLVDYSMETHRPLDAISHINLLLDTDQADPALQVKYAQCQVTVGNDREANKVLAGLVGYDLTLDTFAEPTKPPAGVHEPDAYLQLARLLYRSKGREAADPVMNRMVELNSDSFQAYLERARYRMQLRTLEKGKLEPGEQADKVQIELQEGALADANKALELAPDDANVIAVAAQLLLPQQKYAEARELLEHGIKKNPKSESLYTMMVSTAMSESKNSDEAIEYLAAGLKQLPESPQLLQTYAELLMDRDDVEGVRDTLTKMEKAGYMNEWIAFYRARIQFHDKQWLQAARQFERLRPNMARKPEYLKVTDLLLAQCYENLGEPDRAVDAAKRVLETDPNSVQAHLLMSRSYALLGKPELSKEQIRLASLIRQDHPDDNLGSDKTNLVQTLLDEQMKLPKDKRNWKGVDKVVEASLKENQKLTDAQRESFKVDVEMLKENYVTAYKADVAALQKYPRDVSLWLLKMNIVERAPVPTPEGVENKAEAARISAEIKRKKLFEIMDAADKAVGDNVQLRIQRGHLLTRYRKSVAKVARKKTDKNASQTPETKPDPDRQEIIAELAKLEMGIDDPKKFSDDEQVAFWNTQGMAYYRLRDYHDVRRCWLVVANKRPGDESIREALFTLALDFDEHKDADSAVADIRKVSGSDSALYLFCIASRSVAKVQAELHGKRGMEQAEAAELAQALAALNEALKLRPGWHEIAHLTGTINDIQGDYDKAIENYRTALLLGPANNTISHRIVQLLYAQGRADEVDEALSSIKSLSSGDPLTRLKIKTELDKKNAEGSEQALAKALEAVQDDPENVQNHLILAQVYDSMIPPQPENAEAEYRLAIETDPEVPMSWLMLLSHLKRENKGLVAHEVMNQAKEKLSEKTRPMVLGPAFEMNGDVKSAERQYLDAEKGQPGEIGAMRALAAFYIRAQQHERREALLVPKQAAAYEKSAIDYRDRAIVYLDKILNAKSGTEDLQIVFWARRTKARVLAGLEGYQNLQAAIRLIEQNASAGTLTPEDMRLEADLLAGRADFESRNKAIDLYEQIVKSKGGRLQDLKDQLSPHEQILLADLYNRMGRWPQARDTMEGLIATDKHNRRYVSTLVQMFLQHDDLTSARQWLVELDKQNQGTLKRTETMDKTAAAAEMAKNASILATTNELKARWLAKSGEKEQAEKVVAEYMKEEKPTADGAERTGAVLESMGLEEAAAKSYRAAAALEPRKGLVLAAFLGRHKGNDLNEIFKLYDDARRQWPAYAIVGAALETLDVRKAEVTPKQYKAVLDLIDSGLADNDEHKDELRVQKCQWLELQGRYNEVIPAYRAILADPSFDRLQQARVKNNLSYLLASGNPTKEQAQESLKLVGETIELLGPTCDALDTRAVAYIANGRYKEATKDASAALLENPNALKYYHRAMAQYRDGKNGAAREDLAEAQRLEIESEIMPNERPAYKQLVEELFPPKK